MVFSACVPSKATTWKCIFSLVANHQKTPQISCWLPFWDPPKIIKISPERGGCLGKSTCRGLPSLKLTGLRTCKIDSWKMIVSPFFPAKGCKSCLFSGVKSCQDFREAIFQQLLFTSASGSLLRTLSTGPQTNN